MSTNVQFSVGNFQVGYCWTGPQAYANDLVALLTGVISGNFSGLIIGQNLPEPADQDKAWLRTNPDGTPTRLYLFSGAWLSLHPVPANAQSLLIWKGMEHDLWSYDGGDGSDPGSSAPTATSGAMWQRDTDFDFVFPLGIGTGTAYDGGTALVVTPGDTGGEEKHELLLKEMPNHTHTVPLYAGDGTNHADRVNTTDELTVQNLGYQSGATGGDIGAPHHTWSHQNLPPYRGVIFAKRTARVYYTTS